MTPKQLHRLAMKKLTQELSAKFSDGIFVECGVKQGSSSVIMARNLKVPGVLFDTWSGFPHFAKEDVYGPGRKKKLQKRVKTKEDTFNDCVKNLKANGVFESCTMVRGDILKTVPAYFSKQSNAQVLLLHIDTDLYEPANVAIQTIWNFLMVGGAVMVHDYGDPKWPGIQKCVDEFIKDKNVEFFKCDGFHGAIITKNK